MGENKLWELTGNVRYLKASVWTGTEWIDRLDVLLDTGSEYSWINPNTVEWFDYVVDPITDEEAEEKTSVDIHENPVKPVGKVKVRMKIEEYPRVNSLEFLVAEIPLDPDDFVIGNDAGLEPSPPKVRKRIGRIPRI